MDAKSLAKSKRAHSLHHSKKHQQHHSSKGASSVPSAPTGDKKQSGKQVKEKPVQGHGSRGLPSNWDRYVEEGEEEYGFGSENMVPQDSVSMAATDVVAPKSKGADYAYLISEAKAQSLYSSQSVPLFDDVLDDFYQGLGPLLSVKGQSIASWIGDDNFGSEDKGPPPDEASFLSLNLHTLAEQLAKATLSERLFIEPDLLPPELCTEELQKLSENEQAKDKAGVAEEVFDSLAHGNQFVRSPSNTAGTSTSSSTSTRDEILQAKGIGQTDLPRYTPEINVNTAAKKPAQFEVANAEAELDMLLGSFAETKFLEPNRVTEESWDNSFLTQNDVSSSFSERGSLSQKVPSRSDVTDPDPGLGGSVARDMKLDDIVDDLLRETSILTNKNEGSLADETRSAFRNTPSSSNPVTKSKLTDDFDSWFDTI